VKRRLFTILSALSLLLFVAVLVLWVRSYWRFDSVSRSRAAHFLSFRSESGYVHLSSAQYHRDFDLFSWGWQYESHPAYLPYEHGEEPTKWERLAGIHWRRRAEAGFVSERDVWIAHRNVAVVLAISPLIMLWRASRRRRRSPNELCPACNYDLRATPDRCPECGLVPAAPPPP
jgi:hypothetical protein